MSSALLTSPLVEFKYPVLASQKGLNVQPIRSLSDQEIATLDSHKKAFIDARGRFKLFEIVKRNFGEWERFIQVLEDPELKVVGDSMMELDRLMLNTLSSVNALFNHFRVHFRRTFKGTEKEHAFRDYVKDREKTNPTYAIFADLRDFVQHCGLPIGNVQQTQRPGGPITLKVTAEASWFIENDGDGRDPWKRSKLTAASGTLDFIELMKSFRLFLIEDFGVFTASTYGPRLLEAHNFYATLKEEVENIGGSDSEMVVVESVQTQPREQAGVTHFQFETSLLPQDMLKELGITVTPKATP
jgi:hypothetical protein